MIYRLALFIYSHLTVFCIDVRTTSNKTKSTWFCAIRVLLSFFESHSFSLDKCRRNTENKSARSKRASQNKFFFFQEQLYGSFFSRYECFQIISAGHHFSFFALRHWTWHFLADLFEEKDSTSTLLFRDFRAFLSFHFFVFLRSTATKWNH